MARCPAIKANGERCRGDASPGAEWCFSHDPSYAEQRRRNASRGGRSGGRGRGGELQEIKSEIKRVTAAVLSGELDTGPAAVGLQGFNTLIRACEVQRRTFDVGDLLERLDRLEERADRLRGA